MFYVPVRSALCRIQFLGVPVHLHNSVIIPTQYRLYRPSKFAVLLLHKEMWENSSLVGDMKNSIALSYAKKRCHKSVDHSRSGLRTDANMDGTEDILQLVHKLCHLLTRPSLCGNFMTVTCCPPQQYFVFLECEIQS